MESFEEQDRLFVTKIGSFIPTFKTKPKVLKPTANSEGLDLGTVDPLGSRA